MATKPVNSQAMGRANKAAREGRAANDKITSQMSEQKFKQARIDGISSMPIKDMPAPPGTKKAAQQQKVNDLRNKVQGAIGKGRGMLYDATQAAKKMQKKVK